MKLKKQVHTSCKRSLNSRLRIISPLSLQHITSVDSAEWRRYISSGEAEICTKTGIGCICPSIHLFDSSTNLKQPNTICAIPTPSGTWKQCTFLEHGTSRWDASALTLQTCLKRNLVCMKKYMCWCLCTVNTWYNELNSKIFCHLFNIKFYFFIYSYDLTCKNHTILQHAWKTSCQIQWSCSSTGFPNLGYMYPQGYICLSAGVHLWLAIEIKVLYVYATYYLYPNIYTYIS